MRTCRRLDDRPQRGSWNMAVDEAMLEYAVDHPHAGPTLRWYRWSRPTLSLGYFQSIAERPDELSALDCVRRLTGGGAILHDNELTYSLVIPAGSWPDSAPIRIVHHFHRFVAAALNSLGEARLNAELADQGEVPFLCFLRRSPGDLVAATHKILGSAQRNRRGTLLQHGSILLKTSPHAPELSGIHENLGAIDDEVLATKIEELIRLEWGWNLAPAESLRADETLLARQFERAKYRNDAWICRR